LVLNRQTGELDVIQNWLGHTHGSSRLDKALVKGATMKELKKIRGAIQQHFDHLRIEHGLDINKDGDVYRIVVSKNQFAN